MHFCVKVIMFISWILFKGNMIIDYPVHRHYNEWIIKLICQLIEVYKSPQFISFIIHHSLATFLHRLYDINPPIIYVNYRSWFMAIEHFIVSHNIHLQVTESNLQTKNMCPELPIYIYRYAHELPDYAIFLWG